MEAFGNPDHSSGGPARPAGPLITFVADPEGLSCDRAALKLSDFLAAPSGDALKELMLHVKYMLEINGPESMTAHQLCNRINSCLRDVPSDSPVKGIIQCHIGPLRAFGNSLATLKGAYQGILDDLN